MRKWPIVTRAPRCQTQAEHLWAPQRAARPSSQRAWDSARAGRRVWPCLPSPPHPPPAPLRTRTPGPQRGPLVTQQISVWQTGHLIQSQPPFFCTTMRQAGQCMASPSCTSICRDTGRSHVLRRHRLPNARGGGGPALLVKEAPPHAPGGESCSPSACCSSPGQQHRCEPGSVTCPGTACSSCPREWPAGRDRFRLSPSTLQGPTLSARGENPPHLEHLHPAFSCSRPARLRWAPLSGHCPPGQKAATLPSPPT